MTQSYPIYALSRTFSLQLTLYFAAAESKGYYTGKNNGYPILDILGYLKNTHKNPKLWKSETNPNLGTWFGIL